MFTNKRNPKETNNIKEFYAMKFVESQAKKLNN